MIFWWRAIKQLKEAELVRDMEREADKNAERTWRFLHPDAPQTSADPPCPGCGRRGLVNADNGTVRCVICTRRYDNGEV